MTSGGHARSGPAPTPGSGRSDAIGRNFKSLPAEGYAGEMPEFPRPVIHGSELRHWERAWRTSQAALWATPQWSYVLEDVALYCSLMAWTETPEYPVGIIAQIRGLKAEILLTSDALNRAGYQIVADELGEARDSRKPARASSRSRMQVVNGVPQG